MRHRAAGGAAGGEDAARGEREDGLGEAADIASGYVGDGERVERARGGVEIIGTIAGADLDVAGRDRGVDRSRGVVGGQGHDTRRDVVGREVRADMDARQDASRQRGSGGEPELVADAESGDAGEIEGGLRVLELDLGEREDVAAGPLHEDAGGAVAEAEDASGLGRARVVADVAEDAGIEIKGAGVADTVRVVRAGVIDDEDAGPADEEALAARGADTRQRAGAAEADFAAFDAEATAEGVNSSQVDRAGATVVKRSRRRGTSIDNCPADVGDPGTKQQEYSRVVRSVIEIDRSLEVEGAAACDVVIEIAVTVVIGERGGDPEGVSTHDAGGFAVETDRGVDDVIVRRGGDAAAVEDEYAGGRPEGAGLIEDEVTLNQAHATREGIRRTAGESERRVRRDADVPGRGRRSRGVGDDAVPDGGTEATDIDRAAVRGLRVDEITVDRQQLASGEVVGDGLIVVAAGLGDGAGDGDVVVAGKRGRGVVRERDVLGDSEIATVGEDAGVRETDRTGRTDAGGGQTEGAPVDVEDAGECVAGGRGQDPDAAVGLGDGRRAAVVGEDRRDDIQVGVHATELQRAITRVGEAGDSRGGVQDVGEDDRSGTARLESALTGGAAYEDRSGDDFARADISQADGGIGAGIAEVEEAAAHVGTKRAGGRAGRTDRADHEGLLTEEGIAGVGVGVTEHEHGPADLGERSVAGNHPADGSEIEAREAVVIDLDLAPTRTCDGACLTAARRGGVGRDVDVRPRIDRRDVSSGRDVRPRDELTNGEAGGAARDGERVVRTGVKGDVGTSVRTDLEVTSDLDVSQSGLRAQREMTASEEAGGATDVTPDGRGESGPIDDQRSGVGGEAQQTRGGESLELTGAVAETTTEGAGGLEDAAPIGELEIGGGRQRGTVLGGERAAGDEGASGVGIVRISEDPVRRPTGTLDGELTGTGGAVGIIGQLKVDAAIAGRITAERQDAGAGAEEADGSGVREDDGGVVVVTSEDVVAPRPTDIDGGVSREGEETVGDDRRRAGLLVNVDLATCGEISGGIAGIKEDAAVEDQGGGVGGGVGGVASADAGSLTDIGEGSDGQGAAAQHGRTGVVMEAGEGLRTVAVLDDGDDTGVLVDDAVESSVAVAVA